jgi:hypothetical protein
MRHARLSPAVPIVIVTAMVLSLVIPGVSVRADVLSFYAPQATYIISGAPNSNLGRSIFIVVTTSQTGFVQFPNIMGTNPGQIPPLATVNSAILELWLLSGEGPVVLQVLSPWDENTLTSGNWTGSFGTSAGQMTGSPTLSRNVTAIVSGWVSGTSANYGFGLVAYAFYGMSGGTYYSDDVSTESYRPKLTVDFTPNPIPVTPSTWGAVKALYAD